MVRPAGGEEQELFPFLVMHGRHDRDVRKMGAATVGIVAHEDVAGPNVGIVGQDLFGQPVGFGEILLSKTPKELLLSICTLGGQTPVGGAPP